MENITNFATTAENEYQREDELADDATVAHPDVPGGIFHELPPDPATTDREPDAAGTARAGEALLPPE